MSAIPIGIVGGAALSLALAACADPPTKSWVIAPDATLIRCVNPTNSVGWDVVIDPGRNLVDGFDARIGGRNVDWTDPASHSHYALDRVSGTLSVTRPSSTGGYTGYDRCASERKPA